MSIDITNQKGEHWRTGNTPWRELLAAAFDNGWEPAGTVLYKHPGIHPEMTTIEQDGVTLVIQNGAGDRALGFHQATKSQEITLDWSGSYTACNGQIITSPDAMNLANALQATVDNEPDPDWQERLQTLVDILNGGECRIT